jgi:hypothetical protein
MGAVGAIGETWIWMSILLRFGTLTHDRDKRFSTLHEAAIKGSVLYKKSPDTASLRLETCPYLYIYRSTSAKSADHPLLPSTVASNPSSTIDALLSACIPKLFLNLTYFKAGE